jgi:outer membrane protein assembly factor BamE (lipoprotein component of BamABCDE complex)
MKNFICASMLMASLAGCMTTIGHKFDPQQVSQLKPGSSTIAQATALFGPPTSISTLENGAQTLEWRYAVGNRERASGSHLILLFDESGKMIRVAKVAQLTVQN